MATKHYTVEEVEAYLDNHRKALEEETKQMKAMLVRIHNASVSNRMDAKQFQDMMEFYITEYPERAKQRMEAMVVTGMASIETMTFLVVALTSALKGFGKKDA